MLWNNRVPRELEREKEKCFLLKIRTMNSVIFSFSAKSCGNPGVPQNGKLKSYIFTFKSRVDFDCNRGYKLVGNKYRICQANQRWDGTLPTCERKYIEVYVTLQHWRPKRLNRQCGYSDLKSFFFVCFEFNSLCLLLQQTTFQRYFVVAAAAVVVILKAARNSILFFVASWLHLCTDVALNKKTFLFQ